MSETKIVPIEFKKLTKIAFILKTVAHPLRLGIVTLLHHHEKLAVNEICQLLGAEQSLTSHHLLNMKLKGILSSQREGKKVHYSLKEKDITLIIDCLQNCGCNMGGNEV